MSEANAGDGEKDVLEGFVAAADPTAPLLGEDVKYWWPRDYDVLAIAVDNNAVWTGCTAPIHRQEAHA